jgi:hypothetical protein
MPPYEYKAAQSPDPSNRRNPPSQGSPPKRQMGVPLLLPIRYPETRSQARIPFRPQGVCTGAPETALHKRSIKLIVDNPDKRIRLQSGKWFYYTQATAETWLGNRKVDVMLYGIDGSLLAVEICVTHRLTPDKISDLRADK